ncbi:4Fe-4S dicluster domain-containing protein [Sphingomonas abietis]|uniref:4Fe-4S binding protein n=1 Tax=Sphingomonas abietis TaxID=3012344 RepID=A0ABY7NUR9_9SPHN|nr:4Fe-4S dicluster domain-containing protein [Sphingomonas abietis]WBO24388.1 4Fe-4S binding protein [Sphingomonas abietis]
MNALKLLIQNLMKGPATDPYPFGEPTTPPRLRGRVAIDGEACVACKMCEHVCAGGAIKFVEDEENVHFVVWHNSCVTCGLCAFYCPTKAITVTDNWHGAHRQEDKYKQVDHATIPYSHCTSCGARFLKARDSLMQLAYKSVGAREEQLRDLCPDCRRAESVRKAIP